MKYRTNSEIIGLSSETLVIFAPSLSKNTNCSKGLLLGNGGSIKLSHVPPIGTNNLIDP